MLTCANSKQQPWNSTLPTLIHLPNCKTQFDINQIHARLLTTGFIKNPCLTTKLILKFSSSPHTPLIQFARHIFFSNFAFRNTKTEDPFLWNAVIKSFSHGNHDDDAKQGVYVFGLMIENGVCVDKFSVSLVLKACSRMGLIKEGKQVHGFLRKTGLWSHLYLQNCLIFMYLKCGCVESARQVFDRMPERDSVSFNSMIDGYVKCGMVNLARELFDYMPLEMKNLRTWNCMISGYGVVEDGFKMACELFEKMPQRDLVSWNLMIGCCTKCQKIDLAHALFDRMPEKDFISWAQLIDGYAKMGSIKIARSLFDEMPERDIISWNSMLLACGKAGYMEEARKVFEKIPQQNVVSWNTLLVAYLNNGFPDEVIRLFEKMKVEKFTAPDHLTVTTVLSACAGLGLLEKGREIHVYAQESGLILSPHVTSSLIDMYAKCGCTKSFLNGFYKSQVRDVYCWNALISGLALHGYGVNALKAFDEMVVSYETKPDDITFIALLSACSHSGLVEEGQHLFESMEKDYGVARKMEHYGCLVDLLGRAGFLESAYMIIEMMPFRPGKSVLGALLGACVNHRDLEIGEKVVKILVSNQGDDFHLTDGDYMMVSNLYASCERWDEANCWRAMMNDSGIVKTAGFSAIEVDNRLFKFLAGDQVINEEG